MTQHKKFSLSEFHVDFLTKGFYAFDGTELLKDFDIEQYSDITAISGYDTDLASRNSRFSENQLQSFKNLERDISDRYLKNLNHKLWFVHYWQTVFSNIHKWHKDSADDRDRIILNATLNCYFDDALPNEGGELQFHPCFQCSDVLEDDDPIGKGHALEIDEDSPLITRFFPKKYSIVILNQTSVFLHRVTPTTARRRIIAHGLVLPEFDWFE